MSLVFGAAIIKCAIAERNKNTATNIAKGTVNSFSGTETNL